jgi:hypothetical protein
MLCQEHQNLCHLGFQRHCITIAINAAPLGIDPDIVDKKIRFLASGKNQVFFTVNHWFTELIMQNIANF